MTIVFWIVIAFLALDFGMDVFLLIESRKSVREAEREANLAQLMKQDCLDVRQDVTTMYLTLMEVINGETPGPEKGRTESERTSAGADTDPYLTAVPGELPGVGGES